MVESCKPRLLMFEAYIDHVTQLCMTDNFVLLTSVLRFSLFNSVEYSNLHTREVTGMSSFSINSLSCYV